MSATCFNNNTDSKRTIDKAYIKRRLESKDITTKLLKAYAERKGCCFTEFSSSGHGKLMKDTIKNSNEQENTEPESLSARPLLNEFINNFRRNFRPSLSSTTSCENSIDGMVKYEIYSQPPSSTTTTNNVESIWLPRSMIISDAHRILSTKLYSNNMSKIPADLPDYVLIYENIMIPLENQMKELYEEILKISFRLNRFARPPFRLLVIHKSQLLLLERKESKLLFADNQPISTIQLIMFHLIKNYNNQSENENFNISRPSSTTNDKPVSVPIPEVKMGIISSDPSHSANCDGLRPIIEGIIREENMSSDISMTTDGCLEVLKFMVAPVSVDISYIESIKPSLEKLVHVYDYPLLIALPYDRLMLSQFNRIQCPDGRLAQGIMANGKYYALSNHPYTPMSELQISRGSIIHLMFNSQNDMVSSRNASQVGAMRVTESYDDTFGDYCSVHYDDDTVQLVLPSRLVESMMVSSGMSNDETKIDFLQSFSTVSNNWLNPSMKINESIVHNTNQSNIASADPTQTYEDGPDASSVDDFDASLVDGFDVLSVGRVDGLSVEDFDASSADGFDALSVDDFDELSPNELAVDDHNSARLTNHPSTFSLCLPDRPECFNCLSSLNDDNLECPHCTEVFCRPCIEFIYNDDTNDHCCPKCHNLVAMSDYRRSTIIGRFVADGISALECLKCHTIPRRHRLCSDPACSALFCENCYRQIADSQPGFGDQDNNNPELQKCFQCRTAHTFVSNAVLYYSGRIIEYQTARNIESFSTISSESYTLPNTVWKEEEWLPNEGSLKENYSRLISVIHFKSPHIEFDDQMNRPSLIINEPFEYICPESLQLKYWDGINQWENDTSVRFFQRNSSSVVAYVPHFSKFTVFNNRIIDHIVLHKSLLHFQ